MSWFKPKKPATVRLPFPLERVEALSFIIPPAVFRGLELRHKEKVEAADIWRSKFFNAYLNAYPRYLETQISEHMGAPIRFALMRSILLCSDAEAQTRFNAFRTALEGGDKETEDGFVVGQEDGSQYFKALIEDREADDSATMNLGFALRGLDSFSPLQLTI